MESGGVVGAALVGMGSDGTDGVLGGVDSVTVDVEGASDDALLAVDSWVYEQPRHQTGLFRARSLLG